MKQILFIFVCFVIVLLNVRFLKATDMPVIPTHPALTPGFVGTDTPEAHISHHELSTRVQALLRTKDSAGELLHHTTSLRPQIKVSAQERLIQAADRIVQDPEGVLDEEFVTQEETQELQEESTHTCQESAEPQEFVIDQHLIKVYGIQHRRLFTHVQVSQELTGGAGVGWQERPDRPPLDLKNRIWSRPNGHVHCDCRWAIYDFYERKVFLDPSTGEITPVEDWRLIQKGFIEKTLTFPERVKEHISLKTILSTDTDEWSDLPVFEGEDDLNCEVNEKVCVRGPETRTIQGQTLTRPCLHYRLSYRCQADPINTCRSLRTKAHCHQTHSRCVREVRGKCLIYEQTFRCEIIRTHPQRIHAQGFLNAEGISPASWADNQDLPEVLSKLAIFSHMKEDMNATTGHVFLGQTLHCNKECAGFKNCCKRFGGWGVDLHLSSCKEEERLLAQLREKKRCVFVGSFCAEKVLGICIRKKFSFCCFGSQLARILHEQGRAQLGIGWGEAEHPNCRALSLEELTRLNFDTLDLRELTAELTSKIRTPNITTLTERFAADWRARLPLSTTEGGGESQRGETGETLVPDRAETRLPPTMADTLKTRQDQLRDRAGEYTLHQAGRVGGDHAELVF